jgi:hypothetical protein
MINQHADVMLTSQNLTREGYVHIRLTVDGQFIVEGFSVGEWVYPENEGPREYKLFPGMPTKSLSFFYLGTDLELEELPAPTEKQRAAAARMWMHRGNKFDLCEIKPEGVKPSKDDDGLYLGGTTASFCEWAFSGMNPDEVTKKYGTGQKEFLTKACGDNEEIITVKGK